MSDYTILHEWVIGSHLYGTAREGSDLDLHRLVIPSRYWQVSNRVLTVPQRFETNEELGTQVDIRTTHLGMFIVNLGYNPEFSFHSAYYLPDLKHLWLRKSVLLRFLDIADRMWEHAKTPKNYAQAFMYERNVLSLIQGEKIYPYREADAADLLSILNETFDLAGWRGTELTRTLVLRSALGDTPVDKAALTDYAFIQIQKGNNQ